MLDVENRKIVLAGLNLLNTSGLAGLYVSMKGYNHLRVTIGLAPASGTDTAAITMKQASDTTGTAVKTLAFSNIWKCTTPSQTVDALVKTAVVSNSVTTSALAALELYVIEIDANQLDVANGFDCVRVDITDPGSVSTPAFALYDLSQAKYPSSTPLPSAVVD